MLYVKSEIKENQCTIEIQGELPLIMMELEDLLRQIRIVSENSMGEYAKEMLQYVLKQSFKSDDEIHEELSGMKIPEEVKEYVSERY